MAPQRAVDDLARYVAQILTILEELHDVSPGEWSDGALVTDESYLCDFFEVGSKRSHQSVFDQIGTRLGFLLDHANEDDRYIVRVALRLKRAAEAGPA